MIVPEREAPASGEPLVATPSLARRMACFVYEAMLLFGLALIPGALGAVFLAQTSDRHPLHGDTALRVFAWVMYGTYFVWFWSKRGQTLAMQTWRIRVISADGAPLSTARALIRYLACCLAWFAAPTLLASVLHWPPSTSLAAVAFWIVAYALLALLAPDRQFWHDLACGTRLVNAAARAFGAPVRPRPR